MKITSAEFQKDVSRYQDIALSEPVTITRNGRDHSVLISAEFLGALLNGRVARFVADLDAATLKAIAEAEVPARYAYLDDCPAAGL